MGTSYDAVPYPGSPFPQTHPDRLATLATLFGMQPAPVESCRVLELGCGDGGNLIPMAFGLPLSQFVGIDSASLGISNGQATVNALGLKNICLRVLDVMDVSAELRKFDYIITHGLYSWVPPAVQDKLLAISKENLAPNGVAFMSYNAYPGGHLRQMIREMMLFHVRGVAGPEQRINQAQAFVKFLAEGQSQPDEYQVFLKKELEQILGRGPSALFHDDLAETYSPVYFYQFIEHARQNGLEYLAEANYFEMQERRFPPHVPDMLRALPNNQNVVKEQYLDFLKCRRFRQTLLCHRDIALDHQVKPQCMRAFHLASPARPVSAKPDICSTAEEEFRGARGAAMKTGHPIAKAAIAYLAEIWPRSVHFGELLSTVRTRLCASLSQNGGDREQDAVALSEILLATYAAGLVELHVHVPHFVVELTERPVVSPLARLQAREGTLITTLRHASVELKGPLERQLIQLLDGTRDRATLLNELSSFLDPQKPATVLADELEQSLDNLARFGLLLG